MTDLPVQSETALAHPDVTPLTQTTASRLTDTVPIWMMLLVAPVMGVFAMLGLSVVTFLLIANLKADLTRLDRDAIVRSEQLSELRLAFVTAETRLLDLAAYAANSTDPDGLAKRARRAAVALQTARRRVLTARHDIETAVASASVTEPGGASTLETDIEQWQSLAADAAATMVDDSATGLMIIINVQSLYDKITASLEAAARQVRTDKNTTLRAAWTRMEQTNAGAPVAVLAIGALLGTLNMIAARHISRKLRMFRQAMTEIAEGRLETPIPHAASRDELARMADALRVLRHNTRERQAAETRIAHMAHHDALTGLANRVLFQARIAEALRRSRRGEIAAVLYLDLDHFKAVNDTLGHPVGDALLREVTQRLQLQVREFDTVARLGGDEFAIIMARISQPADSAALAKRLIEAVSAPYEFNGNQVIIGTSIGIAMIPGDGDDPERLMKCADMALYLSKGEGRGRYSFFEPQMDARMHARRVLELDFRKALVESEFQVYYQPIMNIATGSISGFEALVRWAHPQRGIVSPANFIPLAEETGLISHLGKWVLQRACADAMTWPGHLKVAVNLSPVQFKNDMLLEDLVATLADSGLPANRLELEITETALLEGTHSVLGILHRFRDLGVRIALDDFGTGYSSLSYLRHFPFSKVKIDRSFVERLGQDHDCDAIVSAVINLCAQLNLTTTAEGIETEMQLRRLTAMRCTEAQGYLFSCPRPAGEVIAFCQSLNRPQPAEITG